MSNKYSNKIVTKMNRIDEDLTNKIKSWTVEKEDIEPLFEHIEDPLIPTEKEAEFLKMAREQNIDLNQVIKDYSKK